MWLYARTAFRPVVLGRLSVGPGQLLVATHRANADVPLICGALFFGADVWRRHRFRLHFAARDDLFEPGALAALTPGLPPLLRRALFAVDPAPFLARVRVHPVRSRSTMKLAQARRALAPGEPLRAEDVDALWRTVSPEDMPSPPLWQEWAAAAMSDLRELVDVVRARQPLLLFPEGTPSADGGIGPLRRGLSVLVRRGRPEVLVPIGIAYDPLTAGRPRALLGIGAPFAPASGDVDADVIAALRRAMPVTCGQVAASELGTRGTLTLDELDAALAEAVSAEGRPPDPLLVDPVARRRRAAACLAALAGREADDSLLVRLARERADANA
jgi:1-acyl-sn-glycerol-3-phosphate acyltransferase